MPLEQIVKILSNYKNLYILSTTGANLINSLSSEFIPSALKNGTNFAILVPNKDSQFCLDVAELEMPENASFNETRFANEYSNVVTNLIKCVASIDPTSPTAGTIKYGSAFTSLRQTIIMGVDQDGSVWGWMSITLPPKRTNTRTPAIEFSGNIHEENTIASGVYQHLCAIENMAESRNKLFTIQSNTSNDLNFSLEKKSAKRQWEQFQAQAQRQTLEHLKSGTGELIEIAAQHPLLEDGRPALEFEKRLNVGIELYRRLKAEGKIVKIYVPGSVHKYQNKQDIQSLSKAGKQYLLESNIPEEDIYSEEMNDKYKGKDGVYNSADECFVAARIFQDEWMRKLHCICSPNQMVRKQLFYMYFGFLPDFHTVSTNNMFHNLIYELFETIPDILLEDHSWQSWDSLQAQRTRKERKPK